MNENTKNNITMNTKTITPPVSHRVLNLVALNAVLVGLSLLIPTMSHLTALPLYQLNPMLLLMLAGILIGKSRYNSLLLAVALPFVSYLIVGMPTATKALCMAAELSTLSLVFPLLLGTRTTTVATWYSIVVAMLCGKIVYYLMKALLIGGTLVETDPTLQILTLAGYGLLFAAISVGVRRSQDKRYGHGRC